MSETEASLDTNSIAAAKVSSKQAQVLAEMSETLNTLTSLQEVLDDIATLTEPVDVSRDKSGSNDSSNGRSVARKMHNLLVELQKWEGTTTSEGNN
jgi:hypothetical protein